MMKFINSFRSPVYMISNQRGSVLVIGYFVVFILLGIGAAFLSLSMSESRTSERERSTTMAFYIAEAGIERALYDLRQDFIGAATPDWTDGTINSITYSIATSYSTFPYASETPDNSFNDGTYTVEMKEDSSTAGNVYIKSTGTYEGTSEAIEVYVKMIDVSPWDNAIFAGGGASGTVVNGNVDIRGSVHILGDGLNPGDFAVNLGGTAELVGNNYNGMDSGLMAKLPALPTVTHESETVSTLNAELRVKQGIVGLSGSATVGEAQATGNSVKETVNGAYVTNGYGGTSGVSAVYSDNGTSNAYDMGNGVAFPLLTDPYPGYSDYDDYLSDSGTSYTVTPAEAAQLASIDPTSVISIGSGGNTLTVDGSGNMTISGVIYIPNGGDLNIAMQGSNKTITYSGSGTIVATGSAQIDANVVTSGAASYPTNILGVIAADDVGFNGANIDVMGVFYAQDQVVVQKQTDITGTIVANYFDMGTNVPAIYQVPEVINNLPAGMIGQNAKWYKVESWRKL